MSFIAILGAGPIGGALAHRLASRDRTRDLRLIDSEEQVAQGKALDILQSSPVEGFTARLTGIGRLEAAAGAGAIIIADEARGGTEHAGEQALAMLKRLVAMETKAPLVFAGATQRQLMARAFSELRIAPRRLVGSAPGALESAVRALTALECDSSGTEVQLRVLGVPPHAAVIAWEEATVFGQPAAAVIPPHRLAAISGRVPSLWPPGPIVLASAAARVAEAVVHGSRRRLTCFVAMQDAPARGAIAAMPVALGVQGIERVLQPSLTRQERTMLENGLAIS